MIRVYKTNIQRKKDANRILAALAPHYPCSNINFDLEDTDKILRIEYHHEEWDAEPIEHIVQNRGYWIEELEHDVSV